MPFSIVIKDVSKMKVDAVVNSTNRYMIPGGRGVDYAIHKAAGPELEEECRKLAPCELAQVKITGGYHIPCKMILHTVGPRWDGTENSIDLLRQCYENVLSVAVERGCKSIAIPLISSGYKDFPRAVVLQIATEVSKEFLKENDLWIYLNVFRRDEFSSVDNSTTERRVTQASFHFSKDAMTPRPVLRNREEMDGAFAKLCAATEEDEATKKAAKVAPSPGAVPAAVPPKAVAMGADESFGQLVAHLVDHYFGKSSDFYVKANITKYVYSKMKTSPTYIPSRSTALACAVVLQEKGVDANELLKHAGMVLTPSIAQDKVIMNALDQNNYDVFKINVELFENDLPLLGYKTDV